VISKKMFSLAIILLIACSCCVAAASDIFSPHGPSNSLKPEIVHLNANVSAKSIDNTGHRIMSISFDKPNVGQDFFISLDNTPFDNCNNSQKEKVLNAIKNQLGGNFYSQLNKDFNDKPFLTVTGNKGGIVNSFKAGDPKDPDVIFTIDNNRKTYWDFQINGEVTLIPTTLTLNKNGLDLNHLGSNQFTGILNAVDFVKGETKIQSEPLSELVTVSVNSLDYPNDPVHKDFNIMTGNWNANRFKFDLNNVDKLNKGRPGNYSLTVSFATNEISL